VRAALDRLEPIDRGLRTWGRAAIDWGLRGLARHHGNYGILARTWPTGSMVLWVAALLGVSLVFYYL
jgi:multicomponent Na+:H+ antiporter subunit D